MLSEITPLDLDEFLETFNVVSKYGWKARFDHEPEVQCKPFHLPRLSQIMPLISMSFRYAFRFYLRKRLIERRLPFLDPTRHVPWRPIYGVPAGGIGCGSVGRGFRGEFVRSCLIPGMYSYEAQPADQFILTIRKQETVVYQQVLSSQSDPPSSAFGLRYWSWGFPAHHARYVGLYPRSWTIYELPQFHLILVCQQISPVFPHNYKTSSLPCCVFLWKVFNLGTDSLKVSISFSWHGPTPLPRRPVNSDVEDNLQSHNSDSSSAQCDTTNVKFETSLACLSRSASFDLEKTSVHGCTLERLIGDELPCCFGIAAKSTNQVSVSKCPGFLYDRVQWLPSTGSTGHQSSVSSESFNLESKSPLQVHCYKQAPSAQNIWNELQSSSGLKDISSLAYEVPDVQSLRRQPPKLAIMVSASCVVPAGTRSHPGSAELEFALVWHSPVVRFRTKSVVYTRRYARWFPEPGMVGSQRLLEHALCNWRGWVWKIEQWQGPILSNNSLPDWYKSALFNELYYMTDGGTVWLDPVRVQRSDSNQHTACIPIDLVRADKPASKLDPYHLTGRHLADCNSINDAKTSENWKYESWQSRSRLGRDMGLFAYLEGHEYRMFNTVDVHFYSSWALIKLWPKLQLAINYDCADLTIEEDRTETYFIHNGCYGVRHVESSVPHDFGDPENEPWRDPNAYIMFPTDQWKDLNPKFILQAWRDWKLTSDDGYLLYMLPIVSRVVRICRSSWDTDNDGMIENSGFPDQTFDTWRAKGISAYTGGLWLACIYAAHDMLSSALTAHTPFLSSLTQSTDENGISWMDLKKEFQSLLSSAKTAYTQALWTGTYYAYQSSRHGNHDSIMAAQLCGHWFLRVAGAPSDAILPTNQILATLKTIQDGNWRSVKNGTVGAVNGVLPDFKQDISNVQSEEFWVGINYALGATFIMEDMIEQGLALAGACYDTVYNRFGLQYQTPEAYMVDGRFRCPGYMRPLAIWSIQHALELKHVQKVQHSTPLEDSDNE